MSDLTILCIDSASYLKLKTAKALGIKIPDVIMLRADKVIE